MANDCCSLICSFLIPPLGVYWAKGCGCTLLINIILTLFGYFPGLIHACCIIAVFKDDEDEKKPEEEAKKDVEMAKPEGPKTVV
mmetsp:Transcript_18124/g.34522  ORF Transcript_18124/g.34522 Transcript_18124/m.34522 type:complete len:84 (+) Transcript_18124:92-343(+)